MDKEKEYFNLLKRYSFKSIVEFISSYQNNGGYEREKIRIGNVYIATTDKYPMNPITLIRVLIDASKISYNQASRKTITINEIRNICVMRNNVLPLEGIEYTPGKALGSIFAIAKNQSYVKFDDTLSSSFLRDFYIFTVIDKKMELNTSKYMDTKNLIEKLFRTDILSGFANIMLFYQNTISEYKNSFENPFNANESFIINTFGDYIYFDCLKEKEYIPFQHCMIKIGKTFYVPSFALLYNRLSHILYWTLKDKLKNHESDNFFPNRFGDYFEEYIEEFLKHSVGNNYVRIDNLKKDNDGLKKPDFEFTKCGQHFIVECKSRLISFKDVDEKLYEGIFRNKIVDGFSQLKSYKPESKESIRIIVLYEDRFPLIELFEQALRTELKLDEKYWILTIEEFESLMDLSDEKQFLDVISLKYKLQSTNSPISISTSLKRCAAGKAFSSHYLDHIKKLLDDRIKAMTESK